MEIVQNFVNSASEKCLQIQSNPIIFFVFIGILLYAAYMDATQMKIPNNFNKFALVLRILIIPIFPLTLFDIIGGIGLFLALLIVGMININNDMGGDIKFAGVFGAWTGMYLGALGMLGGIILIMPMSFIRRTPQPLAPYITFSTCALFIILTRFI